jgi:hypothetical protein
VAALLVVVAPERQTWILFSGLYLIFSGEPKKLTRWWLAR